jgi:hypothetical protein
MLSPAATDLESVDRDRDVDVDFLAEVLIDLALPLDAGIDLTTHNRSAPSKIERGPSPPAGSTHPRRWRPTDDSAIGRIVSPHDVLRLRRRFRSAHDGIDIDGSKATFYQTGRGFARTAALKLVKARPVGADNTDRGRDCILASAVQHRIEYFLALPDDDFLACFRFNGEITGEYLDQAARCDATHDRRIEPDTAKPGLRRRRKSDSLRRL